MQEIHISMQERVFSLLHERRFQVIFLQEVYSSRSLERVWSAEWGGKVVYSHGSKDSSGTLVLFNPSLDVEVENHETDQRGRLIILRAKIDEYRFIFINVYAPNQGGLEALPMIQRVKVRASFHRCKQNLVIIQGYLQVFTWLLLRFRSLL